MVYYFDPRGNMVICKQNVKRQNSGVQNMVQNNSA